MTSESTVRIAKSDGIAIMTLDKPPVNAIDLTLLDDAERCLENVDEDEKTRSLVITGSGTCFSADLDLKIDCAVRPSVHPDARARLRIRSPTKVMRRRRPSFFLKRMKYLSVGNSRPQDSL